MTDRSLCILYESSDEYIDELMEEIVERARYVAICREINPEDIWKFADGYDSVDDVWNDLDRFNVDERHFIQNCLKLIKENKSIKSGLAV